MSDYSTDSDSSDYSSDEEIYEQKENTIISKKSVSDRKLVRSNIQISTVSIFRVRNKDIRVRQKDTYFSANNLCKYESKKWCQYLNNKKTKSYIKNLTKHLNKTTDELITGNNMNKWIHPFLAHDFAKWISPDFGICIHEIFFMIHNQNLNNKFNMFCMNKHEEMKREIEYYKDKNITLQNKNNIFNKKYKKYKEKSNILEQKYNNVKKQIRLLEKENEKYKKKYNKLRYKKSS